MGAEPTNQPKTYENTQNKRFEQAIRRLKSTPNISDSDRNSIKELVEHLLAKGVGKPRAIKYINHLIVVSRIALEIAGKSLGQFDRKGHGDGDLLHQHSGLHRPYQTRLQNNYQEIFPMAIELRRK